MESTLARWADKWAVIPTDGSALLDLLGQHPADGIICQYHAGDEAGLETLNEIGRVHPRIVRFLRCGRAEKPPSTSFTGVPPGFLWNDVQPEAVDELLTRALLVDRWIANDAIRQLLPQIHLLPALPKIYTGVVTELQSSSASMKVVAGLIAQDPVMTAKILQVVNSAYFGLPRQIASAMDAVLFLGSERTQALILAARVFSLFGTANCTGFSPELEWHHSMEVACLARAIMVAETEDTVVADQSFTAGLLHDIGKSLLVANFPEKYSEVLTQAQRRGTAVHEQEIELFGTSHAELGACLLAIWGLPLPIIEAVAWHHQPSRAIDRTFSPLTAVHVANSISRERASTPPGSLLHPLDMQYLGELGVAQHLSAWQAARRSAE